MFVKDFGRMVAGSLAGIIATVVAFAVILGLGFMWVFGVGFFVDHTADRSGKTQQKQQINGNGNYRIAAYDHFYDLCASVQTAEASISNQQAELKTTKDPQRVAVLNTNITALRNSRAGSINEYNADARKSGTLGQFKASDLPGRLYLTTKETSCTAS